MPAPHHNYEPRLTAERLSFAAPDGRTLFDHLSLGFGAERTGLVGANGSGKTTLLRLLAGELLPSSGSVQRTGRVAVLPQSFSPPPDISVARVLGIHERLAALHRAGAGMATAADIDGIGDDWDLERRAQTLLHSCGLGHLELHRPLGAVSGGEATRLALAALELAAPDFIMLDEPTNHLDAAARARLHDFIEAHTGGLICVSHDRALLRRMDRLVELSSVGVRVYGGNYDEYRTRRDEEDAAAERELNSARAALRRAEQQAREQRERQARRAAQGRRDRAQANMPKILLNGRKAQAEATGARVRAITEREVDERRERTRAARARVEERERPRFQMASTQLPAGRVVLELDDVCFGFPGAERSVLEHVSLRVTGPQRIAITGANGTGKSSLLRIIRGELVPAAGSVRRPPAREIALLDQHGAVLDPEETVLENFRLAHPLMDITAARHALARFLFSHEAALQTVGTLSGGQRLRASLACALGGERTPALLLLDEPTNHLDFDALEALESALNAYDGALIVVSHDMDFLAAIGLDRRFTLDRDGAA